MQKQHDGGVGREPHFSMSARLTLYDFVVVICRDGHGYHSRKNDEKMKMAIALRAIALHAVALRLLALRFIMVNPFTVYRFTGYRFDDVSEKKVPS